ncbi:MAG: hypothetical protein ACRYGR_01750 [Janthinobacterium lividum]
MGLKIHPLLYQEIRRLGFHVRDLILVQFLNLTTLSIFSFLLQEILILYPKVGVCFFWLTQGSAILLLSDRLFSKDLNQGFFENIFNSSTSLSGFIGLRWFLFAVSFAMSSAVIMPISLTVLTLNLDLWVYFLLFIFPYTILMMGYSSLLSLLTHGMRSYLMPILLFPITVPVLILVTSGSLGIDVKMCFLCIVALLLCVLPFILYLIKFILQDIWESC